MHFPSRHPPLSQFAVQLRRLHKQPSAALSTLLQVEPSRGNNRCTKPELSLSCQGKPRRDMRRVWGAVS